jgi:hypothetical protein
MVPIMRAIAATNAELIFACSYPPTRSASCTPPIGLKAMFGGAMIQLLATPIKMQLHPGQWARHLSFIRRRR